MRLRLDDQRVGSRIEVRIGDGAVEGIGPFVGEPFQLIDDSVLVGRHIV